MCLHAVLQPQVPGVLKLLLERLRVVPRGIIRSNINAPVRSAASAGAWRAEAAAGALATMFHA
jgi:hypothetical protein